MKLFIIKLSLIVFFSFFAHNAYAQQGNQPLTGEVSFVTSRNIYVKFDNTSAINVGDHLTLSGSQTPCLQVANKSSSSVVCTLIDNCEVKRGDKVIFTPKTETPVQEPKEEEEGTDEQVAPTSETPSAEEEEDQRKQKVRGRISASSYNIIASQRENRHRLMSRFSFNVDNINDSRFSAETYMNYRQITPQASGRNTYNNSFFRVYNLAVKYDAEPGIHAVLGRKINNKIASVGAIDGLQVEKSLGKNYVGIIGGFRPGLIDFGFNSNLLQYGGYVGRTARNKKTYSQTTLGLIEQRNAGNIDRRYTYFQHSGTIGGNLSLFSSVELDLFSRVNGVVTNEARLTNLYASARYRFGRKLNVMLSYDTRKRIIYYETFQSDIDRLLNDDIARQGIRLRVNVRPVKRIIAGVSFSQRFQSDNQNQSDNLYGYVNVTQLPLVGGSLAINGNFNRSNYLTTRIGAARYSRSLIDQKLDGNVYYRFVNYSFSEGSRGRDQHYIGARLSYNLGKKLQFDISGELSTLNNEQNFRIYTGISRRFYSNRK